ncbi:MAG: VCBS repeat-containing protein [Nitrospirae bacterium]|nr:VCBS repeat-containing protein [Nitrospirota bacterium]
MNNERLWYTVLQRAAIVLAAAVLAACGPGGGGGVGGGSGPATLSPDTADVPVGGRATFTLLPAQAADWTVNDLVGGTATVGRISAIGGYTAPFVIPSPSTVTIAASVATNTATVTIVSRFVAGGTPSIGSCTSSCTPNAVIAPDLNGDGLSDLVTANAGNGTISVVMRGSASTFLVPVSHAVGTSLTAEPQALVAGDFNGDSSRDLVIADADSSAPAVWTRLGQGDGTFPTELSVGLAAGSNPLSIASGRFDPDVNLDVVVANFVTSTLSILRGDGTGTFSTPATISSDIASPLGVAVADFNQDGYDDIAVANSGNVTVVVFMGVGDGTFQTAQIYAMSAGPSAVVATDLNGDGFPDLAVTTATGRQLVLVINKGTSATSGSTFNPPSTTYATGAQPIALAAADINHDGFQDLAVVNKGDNTVTVFLGYGDGTVVASETYPVGNAPLSVAVGDFNGDGWPDLAVANSGDDTVTILRNRGS